MRSSGLSILLLLLIVGCAKPNYQDPQPQVESEKTTPDSAQGPQNPQNPSNPPVPQVCKLFFSVERICVDIKWELVPTQNEMGAFGFKFYMQETPALYLDPRYPPTVMLWMPSMGHGSSPVTIEKLSTGEYKASKVFFIMPGEWEIRLQLKDGKNVVDQIIKKITI